jgi:[acyl-carrier-protein] S-malonyltransferase
MDQVMKPWRHAALIFPGQGSQHHGMAARLVQMSRAAADIFRRADEALDMKLSRVCTEGADDELEQTAIQQPATFVTSIAWLAALQERWEALDRKLEPYVLAGHSMGEYTAAVAAGSLPFEQGAILVRERGLAMEAAGLENPGGMATILGLDEKTITEICLEASSEGYVGLANANCEGQSTISGAISAVKRAMELAERARARRVVRLPISIAGHSPLMAKAGDHMNRLLQKLPIADPNAPLVGNTKAQLIERHPEVYEELRDQLVMGVRWQKSVEEMKAKGADMFIEVGPGSVLTRLVRRIDYGVNSLSISDDNEGLFSEKFKQVEAAAS